MLPLDNIVNIDQCMVVICHQSFSIIIYCFPQPVRTPMLIKHWQNRMCAEAASQCQVFLMISFFFFFFHKTELDPHLWLFLHNCLNEFLNMFLV